MAKIYLCSFDVCQSNQTYKMCPLCDEEIGCRYWFLSEVCKYVTLSWVVDNPGTVAFAAFVSLLGKIIFI